MIQIVCILRHIEEHLLTVIQAEEQGILTPHSGDTIYEGTSGSTGISLATLARAKGYLAHMCVSCSTFLRILY